MMLRLMAYGIVVGLSLAIAGVMLEWAAAAWRLPRRWIWVGTLAASLALGFAMPWRPVPTAPAAASGARTGVFRAMAQSLAPRTGHWSSDWPGASTALGAIRDAVDVVEPICAPLWVSASLGLLVFQTAGHVALWRRRRGWRETEVNGVRVRVAPDHGPAVVGVWQPGIVLPRWALAFESSELDLILRHEREHQQVRDPLLIQLATMAVIAMPWNPSAWWMLSRLKLAVEMDCDARVMASATREEGAAGTHALAYGELLLSVAIRRSPRFAFMGPALIERRSSLARRIAAMYPSDTRFVTLRGVMTCGAAAIFAAAAIAVPAPRLPAQAARLAVDGAVAGQTGRQGDGPLAAAPADQRPALTRAPAMERSAIDDQQPVAPEDQAFEPGQGRVTFPIPIKRVDPQYTEAAMQARIQGMVRLRAVVEPNGHVDRIRVVKSLDSTYGLDQAAIDAAAKWEFKPATKDGKPVPVWIEMELDFRLNAQTMSIAEFASGAYPPDTPARPHLRSG